MRLTPLKRARTAVETNMRDLAMGRLEKDGDTYVYRQDDGEITAWLADDEEKLVLAHEGDRFYRRVFYTLVLAGLIYLAVVFFI